MKTIIFIILVFVGLPNAMGQIASPHDLPFEKKVVYVCLAAEARGEGEEGVYAVACVIEQRSRLRNLSISSVCLQPYQFSCFTNRSISDLDFLLDKKGPIFDYILELVQNWDLVDPKRMLEADHYHANTIKPPYWAKNQTPVKVIKNHIFYKL